MNYAGIDPGIHGAIALLSDGEPQVWDMPVTGGRRPDLNLGELDGIIRILRIMPDCVCGVEWPTTRPGEGAERSARFGRQLGAIEALLYARGVQYRKLAPHLWKGRLGLPGKDDPSARTVVPAAWEMYYPEHAGLIRGPRGGLLDGRLDALLMAHFMRTQSVAGQRSIVAEHGKESPQALSLITRLGRGRGKNRPYF